jgi:hypothetical protein
MASVDRRQDVRYATDAGVELTAVTPGGDHLFVKAKCEDVSRRGLRVLAPAALEPKTAVSIRSPELRVHTSGVVRHCRWVKGGYSVGIHLTAALNVERLAPLPAA